MNRYSQLARLKDEVGRLFADGIDENAIFEQLHDDPRFATISRTDVNSFYKRMEKKVKMKDKNERQLTEFEEKHKRQVSEMKRIKKSCQKAVNHLLYNAAAGEYVNIWNVLQSRFSWDTVDATQDQNSHKIKLLDLFQHESKTFEIPKLNNYCRLYTLSFLFFLLIDDDIPLTDCYIRLVQFNPKNNSFQIVQTINYDRFCYALIDLCDSTKIILMSNDDQMQTCKLANGQIQTGEMREKSEMLLEKCVSYFEDHIYDLHVSWGEENGSFLIKVLTWNLNNDESNIDVLNSLPDSLTFAELTEDDYSSCEWIRDKLFVSVQFVLTNDFGIVYADLQTKNWTLIRFAIACPIFSMRFVNDKNLMIKTVENDKTKIYKLSMRKPDSLRNMAWIKLVNLFKQAKVEDPYVEARKYLPLNSDIQPFIFTEE